MRYLRDAEDLPSFFRRVRTADRRVLLLDYDGTLAPFRTDRNQAVPYPGVREVLADIISQHSTRVVIISGRAVADVSRLIGLSPLPEIWGSHGWEHLTVDGAYTLFPLDPASQGKLGEARDRLDRLGLSQHREDKPVSVAVHWRGLPTHDAERIRQMVSDAWTPLAAGSGLELHPFDGGLELRARGRNKGDSVRAVLPEEGDGASLAAAFLGDDLTDEDAFEALAGRGLRVLVRRDFRDTAADLWIVPPEELLEFLENWKASLLPVHAAE